MNSWIKLILVASLIALACAAVAAAQSDSKSVTTQTAKTSHEAKHEHSWAWQWREDGVSLELKMRGKVEFNDDYTDVVSIAPGGWLRIKDERGGKSRHIEITPTGDGSLTRSYSIDGQSRPFDSEARTWFARFLNEATLQAGLDAANRARKILSREGPAGLLDAVSRLHGDYVKRTYFQELIKSGRLDAQTARRLAAQAAREMYSDYEKAQTLVKLADASIDRDGWRAAYIEATRSIYSDYERKRALAALLGKGNLSREELLLAVNSASDISSDYEKAQVFVKVINASGGDREVHNAVIDAARTISSDYERSRVMKAASR